MRRARNAGSSLRCCTNSWSAVSEWAGASVPCHGHALQRNTRFKRVFRRPQSLQAIAHAEFAHQSETMRLENAPQTVGINLHGSFRRAQPRHDLFETHRLAVGFQQHLSEARTLAAHDVLHTVYLDVRSVGVDLDHCSSTLVDRASEFGARTAHFRLRGNAV